MVTARAGGLTRRKRRAMGAAQNDRMTLSKMMRSWPSPSLPRVAKILALGLAGLALAGCQTWPGQQPLTLAQKAGQMVMMGIDGTDAASPAVQQALAQIRAGQLGGVILFRNNITSPGQVQALNAALQAANPLPALPLLIALDQEGGLVQRLRASNGFEDTPAPEQVATSQTPEQAYATYRHMASMVKGAGFNFNLGPVVDLRCDPHDETHQPASAVIGVLGRSFADEPAVAERYATAFIRAHHDEGLLTALKHYPGHGLAHDDSHLGLVDVTDTVQSMELRPFRHLIRAGLADAVLTAHLVNRRIDPDWPITLSQKMIGPHLRERLHFGGVVVTDDMHMGAIQKYHGEREALVRAIQACNDLLVYSNSAVAAREVPGFAPRYDMGQHLAALVQDAIARGELTPQQIEASWQRLARLRARLHPALPLAGNLPGGD